MSRAIEFENVDIVFGEKQSEALEMIDAGEDRTTILEKTGSVLGCAGANLAVDEGEISVLMGLSGSGKSTLLRSVNRLNEVARGSVRVNHEGKMIDIVRCEAAMLRDVRQRTVSMVFQQFGLLPWRTVEDNVGFGLELAGVSADERKKRVQRQLALVDLSDWAGKQVHELSGGMQQRVGLARAFATDAPILLMDEPFSALDPLIRTKLQDALLDWQKVLKKTILFVSHDLEEALKIGNRITIMEGGRIVQSGAPEDIILRPANDYVRDFIANVNPLSVLTAWNVMRDRRDLESAGGDWVWLDRRKATRFKLDKDQCVIGAERNGKPVSWSPCSGLEGQGDEPDLVYWAQQGTPLKTVMLAIHRSQTAPVAVFDDSSRFLGSIGVRDVLKAILRR
ncbi:MAG: choline ABC transporter ATP-binding protein [Rhizobiaceae bacterium]